MLKVTIHNEDMIVLNIYVPNNIITNFFKAETKGDRNTLYIGDLNAPPSV